MVILKTYRQDHLEINKGPSVTNTLHYEYHQSDENLI